MASGNNVCIFTLSKNAALMALTIQDRLPMECTIYIPERHKNILEPKRYIYYFDSSLKSVVSDNFNAYSRLIFIMASGIVVRTISNIIKDKKTDPGVLVIDEKGRYVISLLSGHIGGANRLAREVARLIGGEPVITTASDINNIPPLDEIIDKMSWHVDDELKLAHIMSSILNDEDVYISDCTGFLRDFYKGQKNIRFIDDESSLKDYMDIKNLIIVSHSTGANFPPDSLVIIPKDLVVGIGCKRGASLERLKAGIEGVFEREDININSIRNLATIDIKSEEPAINHYSDELDIPVEYYSKEDIIKFGSVPSPSLSVKKYIGVEGVCEAAAMMSAGNKSLLIKKQKIEDVTLAIAKVNYS